MRAYKFNWPLATILIIGFIIRLAAAIADPFLHPWDERFHALVARNMMDLPFKPMLRAHPIFNYDPNIWCCNHIWLHKQPLFMWQMALSMKVFGVSEWAMRLPSVLAGTLLIIALYRIAKLVTNNKTVALISAALMAFSGYHIRLISGMQGMDHNDVAHGFYVLLSIWAFLEYNESKKAGWLILIGAFAGAAVLNKWLTGLLVFCGWATYIITDTVSNKSIPKKSVLHFVLAVMVCLAVFVPWQLYILYTFPNLAQHEYAYNTKHVFEAVEGHSGSWRFYLDHLDSLVGKYIYLLVPIGMVVALKTLQDKKAVLMLITQTLFVFCFYSFIVATKIDTYIFFIVPILFLFIAIATYWIIRKRNLSLRLAIIVILVMLTLRPDFFWKYYSSSNTERNDRIHNAAIYKNLKKCIPPNVHLVMNMNTFEDVDVMFYNNDITAYAWTMSEDDAKNLAGKKVPIAIFKPHGDYQFPAWINSYPYLYIIDKELKNF